MIGEMLWTDQINTERPDCAAPQRPNGLRECEAMLREAWQVWTFDIALRRRRRTHRRVRSRGREVDGRSSEPEPAISQFRKRLSSRA